MNGSLHLWLLPVIPFAGFLLNGLLGRRLPKALVTGIAWIATLVPFLLVANIWFHLGSIQQPYIENLGTWIAAGSFHADFALQLDHLTMIMLLVVTGVGFLIHIYSAGYMAHEEGYWRFFAYLNLFMFFMLTLVLSENFLLMFVGWEGVGLASYLLIGFYFLKDSAANAGKKAFVVNRIGDFGFLLAMFLLVAHFGTLSYSGVFAQISQHPEWQGGFLTAIAILLVVGATGKSAQIPLYVWLPDAMEGPTPVSALIHAATMVTAGVYMIARSHVLFDRSPFALTIVAIIGAATAFFAATIGLVQTDIKRVLAYSTVSQLGYMFLACGVASYASGIFHLVTHAFFKALLFLAAGSVIHALGGEQDMRVMGGLRKKIPATFWTMTAGVIAIAGIPPFAGFFSKDEILYQAFLSPNGGKILWFVGLVTAFLTSFYMFRLWYLTFFGESRAHEASALLDHGAAVHASSSSTLTLEEEPDHGHGHGHGHGVHESPAVMLIPLAILALLSFIGGWIGVPAALHGHNEIAHFLAPIFGGEENPAGSNGLALTLAAVSTLTAIAGWFTAHFLYYMRPELPAKLAQSMRGLYLLLLNKYKVDELYNFVFVTPLLLFSRYALKTVFDMGVVDGAAYAAGSVTQGLGAIAQRFQSGNLRSYAGWLSLGAAVLLILTYFGFTTHFTLR
ncbi:NADH-quinone oxidoreductase subunit L [Silvibacterium dinghuense]|uniref:NADH-quinone oxidoreductase subunit L n=1 Tax=Silvibacterium dinghuense TaxID=1560006 RepID=A0A4Q1SDK4_9BACT|nr:NADH-quinone oxidoreductase subunit L [Silvibacterium dinghuense]RXS95167.1 NADH-quinone oxidoreductase subunit L [Silvibacterium dinghuense]GGH11246.1 NADH-quinone oxidoreductase subunit L [Silvibacterium dinghuense]